MTLEEAQKQVDQWVKTYGVRYFSELTNMAVLTEEVGELARVMARKYGDQSFKEGEKDNIEEEIADVLWVLLCIANQTGVDVTAALQKSMEKKTKRDSKRHINNPKLNDHGGEYSLSNKYDAALAKYNTHLSDADFPARVAY
jgi:Predicted pyrophosphatase